MNRIVLALRIVAFGILTLGFASLAHAQPLENHTFVSGDVINEAGRPCTRDDPCKTFARALTKTNPGGEIIAITAGDFGPVTIDKAVTIDGNGVVAVATQTDPSANSAAITVAAGAQDEVILRNLSFSGAGLGWTGIRYISGRALEVEDCWISGFTHNGIDVSLAVTGAVKVENTIIENLLNPNAIGINMTMTTAAGYVIASINNIKVQNLIGANASGIDAVTRVRAVVRDSVFTLNSTGVKTSPGGTDSIVDVENSLVSFCNEALRSAPGSIIRVSNTMVTQNNNGIGPGGGQIISLGGNSVAGNSNPGAFTSFIGKL
jgi:hypothetical protein